MEDLLAGPFGEVISRSSSQESRLFAIVRVDVDAILWHLKQSKITSLRLASSPFTCPYKDAPIRDGLPLASLIPSHVLIIDF